MTLENLLKQIEMLRDMWLTPLGKARRIMVKSVDHESRRVVISVEGVGALKSRSFAEFQRLIDALKDRPAVHVDSELAGSGSSRNQPETILANLPGIEYLRIGGKKHLTVVSERSRPYGTVREMDSISAVEVAQALQDSEAAPFVSTLIVDDAFMIFARALGERLGLSVQSIAADIIQIGKRSDGLVVAGPSIGLAAGVYPVMKAQAPIGQPGTVIRLAEREAVVHLFHGRAVGFFR